MQNNEREAKGKISHLKITTSMTITGLDCTGLGRKRSKLKVKIDTHTEQCNVAVIIKYEIKSD